MLHVSPVAGQPDGPILAKQVVSNNMILGPTAIHHDAGIITSLEQLRDAPASAYDLLVPGFIDLQVNGLADLDVQVASPARLAQLSLKLAAHGVAGWLPTIVTRPLDSYGELFDVVESAMDAQSAHVGTAAILGAHLEGPFLGARPGAHRREWIAPVDMAFLDALPAMVRVVTLAPEASGAVEATRLLTERGVVVAIGHTAATSEQLDAVHHAGARLVTHLYNAMPGVHHRDDSVATWALTTDSVTTSVIADLGHVSPRALDIAVRCKPEARFVAVSDSVAHLGGQLTGGGSGTPATLPDGTIAGSTATMSDCFANLASVGLGPVASSAACATNPAALLGWADRGQIAVGSRCDVVSVGADRRTISAWIGGIRTVQDNG